MMQIAMKSAISTMPRMAAPAAVPGMPVKEPGDAPVPIQDPRDVIHRQLLAARDLIVRASAETAASDRYDVTLPFWTHNAVAHAAAGAALAESAHDISETIKGVLFNSLVISQPLDRARDAILEAVTHSASKEIALKNIAQAHWEIAQSLKQLDFTLQRLWPEA